MKALFWRIISRPLGRFLHLGLCLIERSSKVRVPGVDPGASRAVIYVNWHQHLPFLIPFHGRSAHWMLVSRAPYMQSIAHWCLLAGLRLVRGASGEDGRASATALAEKLKAGESVVLAVDGPAGPAFEVKRGCVELSRATGAPIVAVAYRCKRARPNPWRWDHSLIPWLFDEITVLFEEVEPDLSRVSDALNRLARAPSSPRRP